MLIDRLKFVQHKSMGIIMRDQGRLIEWLMEKGYGFISA